MFVEIRRRLTCRARTHTHTQRIDFYVKLTEYAKHLSRTTIHAINEKKERKKAEINTNCCLVRVKYKMQPKTCAQNKCGRTKWIYIAAISQITMVQRHQKVFMSLIKTFFEFVCSEPLSHRPFIRLSTFKEAAFLLF